MSYTEQELRLMKTFIQSSDWPLPIDKWPNSEECKTNCLAYALGLPIHDPIGHLFGHMESYEQFEALLLQLELSFRRVSNENELKDDEYGIIFYLIPYRDKTFECMHYDSHFVRIELDRSWTNKNGYRLRPKTIINKEELREFTEYRIYAVRKPR